MLYELQVLRNAEPVEDRQAAVSTLDGFDYHLIGQPCSIRYYDENGKIRLLFAVGKRSYLTDSEVYNDDRSLNYEIINDYEDSTLYWETFSETLNNIIPTGDIVQILFSDINKWQQEIELGVVRDNQINFLSDENTGIKKIAKGTVVFATNSLSDLVLDEDSVIGGVEFNAGDGLLYILEELKNSITELDLKWNDNMSLKPVEMTHADWKNNVKTDLEEGNRNLYEVTLNHDYAPKAHFIGENKVGDAYITNIKDGTRRSVLNFGDFHYDNTINDFNDLSKMSVTEIIDKLILPEHPLVNYALVTRCQIDEMFDKNWYYDPDKSDLPIGTPTAHVEISHDDINEIVSGVDDNLWFDIDKTKTITPDDVLVRKVNTIIEDTNIPEP